MLPIRVWMIQIQQIQYKEEKELYYCSSDGILQAELVINTLALFFFAISLIAVRGVLSELANIAKGYLRIKIDLTGRNDYDKL